MASKQGVKFSVGAAKRTKRSVLRTEAFMQPRHLRGPKGIRVEGGGDVGGDQAIWVAIVGSGGIGAAEGEGISREPGVGTATPFLGTSESGEIHNYTLTEIPEDSFVVVARMGDENVAIAAWC